MCCIHITWHDCYNHSKIMLIKCIVYIVYVCLLLQYIFFNLTILGLRQQSFDKYFLSAT